MNKLIPMLAAILFAVASVMLLAACGGAEDGGGQTAPAEGTAVAATSSDVAPESEVGKPLFYNSAYGTATTGNGYYESFSWVSGRTNIIYTDYAAATQRVLCYKDGCAHDGPDCTGWRGNISSISQMDEQLLLASDCYTDWPDEQFHPLRLELVDPATGDARTLATLSDTDMYEGAMAWDADNVYLMLTTYTEAGEARQRMVKVAMKDGRQETVFTLDGHHFLVGVMEDKFILKRFITEGGRDGEGPFFVELYTVPSSGQGGPTPLLNWDEEEMQAMVYGSELVYLKKTGEVGVRDLATGQEQVYGSMPAPKENGSLYLDSMWDNYVVMNGWDSESGIGGCYVMDENGAVHLHELTMSSARLDSPPVTQLSYGGGPDPVRILADAGDRFLVLPAIDFFPATYYGNDNDPYDVDIELRRYALIDKEDFWAGNADYTMVDMAGRTSVLMDALRQMDAI